LLAIDPDPKFSNGNVADEFIYTPGQVQTATINVTGALAKAVDITPFNQTPNALGADQPLYDANHSDDVIYGGWDTDFLHGADGSVWKTGVAPTAYQHFLNFDAADGRTTPLGCIQATNSGCLAYGTVKTDGGDAIFGDLGNDWMVGGTGNDTIWAGWGNDLSN